MKTLFLVTKSYPFGPYEQYITNELHCIYPLFQKIIIYPNDYYEDEKPHSIPLPPNVEVLNLNRSLPGKARNNLADYLYLFRITLQECLTTDDKKHFFGLFRWNLAHFWTQFQLARLFSGYLEKNGYTSENSVFYSYWFHKGAILLSILKDRKKIDYFVCRSHSIELYHNDWKILDEHHKVPSFKMFKLRTTPKILAVSRHGYDYLSRKYPRYRSKFFVSYLGVPSPETRPPHDRPEDFHIVTCSTVDENKRIYRLAEALTKLNCNIRWTHFGSGSKEHMETVRRITRRVPSNIQIHLAGSVTNKEVLRFYSTTRVDLFVNLSIVEGLPVSIMEALSHGIPVLATAVYGTPEAVIENVSGFLLDVNFTTEELVTKLESLVQNRALLKGLREGCRRIHAEKFEAKNNYAHFAGAFLMN